MTNTTGRFYTFLYDKKVGEKLTAVSDTLAEQQAERIVAERLRIEERRYQEPGRNGGQRTQQETPTPLAESPNGQGR